MSPALAGYSDHVRTLMHEMAEFEKELSDLWHQHGLAVKARRECKANYAHLVKKTELLNRLKKRNEIELYWAALSGECPSRIEKAEDKLRKNNIDHYELQMTTTHRLRDLTEALRRETHLVQRLREHQARIVRKQEELHRHRPCEVFLCDHCRRRKRGYRAGAADEKKMRGSGGFGWAEWGFLLRKERGSRSRSTRRGGGRQRLDIWGEEVEVVEQQQRQQRVVEEDDDVFNLKGANGVLFKVKRAFSGLRRSS